MNNKYPIRVQADQNFISRHSTSWLRGQSKMNCLIWGTRSSSIHTYTTDDKKTTFKGVFSPRAGGFYLIDAFLNFDNVAQKLRTPTEKACFTTWLIKEIKSSDPAPCITVQTLDEVSNLKPMKTTVKAEKFMNFLAKRKDLWSFFKIFDFQNENDDYINTASMNTLFLFSETESANRSEIFQIISYLSSKNYINMVNSPQNTASTPDSIVLTLEGKIAVENNENTDKHATNKNILSKQVFIAMWIDDEMKPFLKSLKKGIENAGYQPFMIAEHHHNKKIDAEIIKQIEASKFIIVDSTHGDDGARGSVYYEAGYAHGIKKEVIFTCRKDIIEKVHFDTRQYFHITWSEDKLEEFSKEIEKHIKATITD